MYQFFFLGLLLPIVAGAVQLPTDSDALRSLPWPLGTALRGSYVSMVKLGNMHYYFSEKTPSDSISGINLYGGKDEKRPKYLGVIAARAMISDVREADGTLAKKRVFTRLTVRHSARDKRLYALANVSNGYPAKDGKVVPSLWVSHSEKPTGGWSYLGKLGGELAVLNGAYSSMGFLVNDQFDEAVNHKDPLRNKFIYFIDLVHGSERGLTITYSRDGREWFFHRDSAGRPVNLRPAQFHADAAWNFFSVVKTPEGYHAIVGPGWPPDRHRLLYSADGYSWMEAASTANSSFANHKAAKNVGLSYEPVSGMVSFLITQSAIAKEHVKYLAKQAARNLVPEVAPVVSPTR